MMESSQPTVLVIEDEPQVLKLIRTILNGAGYCVLEARSHAQAAKAAADKAVDLIILGSPPRRSDHLHTARKALLLSQGPGDSPGIRVLQKPFTPAALRRAVEEILG